MPAPPRWVQAAVSRCGCRTRAPSSCSTAGTASRRRARRSSTTTDYERPSTASRRPAHAHGRLRRPAARLRRGHRGAARRRGTFVSESIFGGLWMIGRDGRIRPGIVPPDPTRAAEEPRPVPRSRATAPARSAACRSRPQETASRPVRRLARRPRRLSSTSARPARAACRRSSSRRCCDATRSPIARDRSDSRVVSSGVRPREPEGHHLQPAGTSTTTRSTRVIRSARSADPDRLATGRREVLSTDQSLLRLHDRDRVPAARALRQGQPARHRVRPGIPLGDAQRRADAGHVPPAVHGRGVLAQIVLLHGFTGSPRVWELVMPRLHAHDVLVPALPGHLGGPALPKEITPTTMVEAVERALDEAGFETAHVVGNSLGGYVALQLAARGRARAVTAFAPAGGWEDEAGKHETLGLHALPDARHDRRGPVAALRADGRRRHDRGGTVRGGAADDRVRGRQRLAARSRSSARCGSSGAPRTGSCRGRRRPRATGASWPTPTGWSSTASGHCPQLERAARDGRAHPHLTHTHIGI